MTFAEILRLPRQALRQMPWVWVLSLVALVGATFYPSDLPSYDYGKEGKQSALVMGTENYGRLTNTVLQIGVPLLLRDVTGIKQLVVVTVAGILASHGPKRILNDVVVGDTRLGERPSGENSRHNMPSGHSTLAASAVMFLMRRYSLWWGLLTIPVMALTMYARVMQDMHTISAVIAGMLTGLIITALFTTGRKP